VSRRHVAEAGGAERLFVRARVLRSARSAHGAQRAHGAAEAVRSLQREPEAAAAARAGTAGGGGHTAGRRERGGRRGRRRAAGAKPVAEAVRVRLLELDDGPARDGPVQYPLWTVREFAVRPGVIPPARAAARDGLK